MKPQISNALIIAAGKELMSEGKPVNGWSLRSRVGAGTPARMEKVWSDHISGALEKAQSAPAEPLPVEVLAQMDRARAEIAEAFAAELKKIAERINDAAISAAKTEKQIQPVVAPDLVTALARIEELEKQLKFEEFRYEKLEQQLQGLYDSVLDRDTHIRELKAEVIELKAQIPPPPRTDDDDENMDLDDYIDRSSKRKE